MAGLAPPSGSAPSNEFDLGWVCRATARGPPFATTPFQADCMGPAGLPPIPSADDVTQQPSIAFDPADKHANKSEGSVGKGGNGPKAPPPERRGLWYHRGKAKGKKGSDGNVLWHLNIARGSVEEGMFGKGGKGKGGKSTEGKKFCFWADWEPTCQIHATSIWKAKSKRERTHDVCATRPKAQVLQSDGSLSNHYEQQGVEWDGAEADDQPFPLELASNKGFFVYFAVIYTTRVPAP